MILVLLGTLEQRTHDILPVQKHFFEAWLATWPMPDSPDTPSFRLCLPLPGGFTLGLALLINLTASGIRFFRPSWGKLGVTLIHAGVVVLLVGGFAIAKWQEEYFMQITEGQSRNFVEKSAPTAAASDTSQPAPTRLELPFSLHLDKFTHEVHPGSSIAKSYSSALRIVPKDGKPEDGRAVLIRMNSPLRHEGFSFYQSSFGHNADGTEFTVLQVVRNPGWALPYAAFYLVGAGMFLQFLISVVKFAGKSAKRGNGAATAVAVAATALCMMGGVSGVAAEADGHTHGQTPTNTDEHTHAQDGQASPLFADQKNLEAHYGRAQAAVMAKFGYNILNETAHDTTAKATPVIRAFAELPVQ
jgi:hypothetical protein